MAMTEIVRTSKVCDRCGREIDVKEVPVAAAEAVIKNVHVEKCEEGVEVSVLANSELAPSIPFAGALEINSNGGSLIHWEDLCEVCQEMVDARLEWFEQKVTRPSVRRSKMKAKMAADTGPIPGVQQGA